MKWLKGCLLATGVLFVLAAAVVAVVFYASSDAVGAADEFLAAIGRGELEAAYRQTAPAFRSQQDEQAFAAVVERLGLAEYAESSWSTRSIQTGRAELGGSFRTRAGDRIPLEMTLIKVDGDWKVFSLSAPQAGARVAEPAGALPPTRPTLPDAGELARLSTDAILALNQAIVADDFSGFYASVSTTWQAQTTPEALAEAFKVFVEHKINISGVADVQPVFDSEPQIDQDGVLRLSGHYPTTPVKVHFQLKFVHEAPQWKLLGIQIDLRE